MIHIYYYNNDYTKPIKLNWYNNDYIVVSSSYWNSEFGTFDTLTNTIIFNNSLGKGLLYSDYIDFGTTRWNKDTRKNILFIGANDMCEIGNYIDKYNTGLFIEAVPSTYERLKYVLMFVDKFNTNYIPINKLVTSENNKEYVFNIFNNNEASSSIYAPNSNTWMWPHVNIVKKITLISTRIENILKEQKWENTIYDLVIDVQGAELEVLKGFSSQNLNNIRNVTIEISKEEFYIGGVLFDELNTFLVDNKFQLIHAPNEVHCDATYTRILN
jgi:FkbM family methyltransferase